MKSSHSTFMPLERLSAVLLLAGTIPAVAQFAASNSIPTPRPLDPATNSTNPSAAATQAQNPYLGSVPTTELQPGVLSLSLDQAVQLALRSNLGLINTGQRTLAMRAARLQALSTLLPQLSAEASQHYTMTETTEATGGQKIGLAYLVGPYSYQSLRIDFAQVTFSTTDMYRLRGANQEMLAAQMSTRDSRNIVVLAAASAYIAIASSESRVHADEAALASARAFENLMQDRVEHGVSPDIELIRARVSARSAEQRLGIAQVQLEKDKLALTRIIGLPIEQQFTLSTPLVDHEPLQVSLADMLERARTQRADLQAAAYSESAAKTDVAAAKAQRLPEVSINAHYGGAGITPAHLYNDYDVSASIRMPLFTGGRIAAEVDTASAAFAERHAEHLDLEARVNYDVRSAFLDLQQARQSVAVASQNMGLAKEGLKEANDRLEVGLANALDVIEAQQAIAEAEDNYISSVYAHNLARLMLIRAMGTAEDDIQAYMEGK